MGSIIQNTSPFLNDLRYNDQDIEDKAKIDALIIASEEFFTSWCNRTSIPANNFSEIHDGDNTHQLMINEPPINSLTSISIVQSLTTILDASEFQFKALSGIIQFNLTGAVDHTQFTCFPRGFQNIIVNYNGGFTVIPEPIKLIVAEMVIEFFDRDLAAQQIESEQLGQYIADKGIDHFQTVLFRRSKIASAYKVKKL